MYRKVLWLTSWLLPLGALSQGMRFTPPPGLIDQKSSLAQPGNVPVPLSPTNVNLEVVNWSTAMTASPDKGQFLLKLVQPARIGSILVDANAEISCGAGGQSTTLVRITDGASRLRLLPLNPEPLDFIKLIAVSQKQPEKGGFRATVAFLTLLPVRATNIAAVAEATASSGDAKLLIDGLAEETQTVVAEASGPKSNAWIKLTWKAPQSIRGLAFFGGRDPTPLEDLVLEYSSASSFAMIDGQPTEPGKFHNNCLFVSYQPITAHSVRIRQRQPQKPIRLGEIVILQELALPAARKP